MNVLVTILSQHYSGAIPSIEKLKVLYNNGSTVSLKWWTKTEEIRIKAIACNAGWNIIRQ